jgi:hypothetical protein
MIIKVAIPESGALNQSDEFSIPILKRNFICIAADAMLYNSRIT